MCSGDEGESSADARGESGGESMWGRAERLRQRSMEAVDEATAADEAPAADGGPTKDGWPTLGRERSLSAASGSSEEEPLMARKRARQEKSD